MKQHMNKEDIQKFAIQKSAELYSEQFMIGKDYYLHTSLGKLIDLVSMKDGYPVIGAGYLVLMPIYKLDNQIFNNHGINLFRINGAINIIKHANILQFEDTDALLKDVFGNDIDEVNKEIALYSVIHLCIYYGLLNVHKLAIKEVERMQSQFIVDTMNYIILAELLITKLKNKVMANILLTALSFNKSFHKVTNSNFITGYFYDLCHLLKEYDVVEKVSNSFTGTTDVTKVRPTLVDYFINDFLPNSEFKEYLTLVQPMYEQFNERMKESCVLTVSTQ